jgi:beta-glucanase (GH16 family)
MWDESTLVWYVDGKEVGRYTKSANQSNLNQGQWPFDKHFHLILNQSVGNGSWAKNADVTHTYETRFDWVRIYQKRGMENTDGTVGVVKVKGGDEVTVNAVDGGLKISVATPDGVSVYDVAGRKVAYVPTAAAVSVKLAPGVYVVAGNKYVVK